MGSRIGDAEADRHDIEKRRLGQLATRAAQIVAGVKQQFVGARYETVANQHRSAIDPAICVGDERLQDRPHLPADPGKNDVQAFCRLAERRVEHVGRQSGHGVGAPMI